MTCCAKFRRRIFNGFRLNSFALVVVRRKSCSMAWRCYVLDLVVGGVVHVHFYGITARSSCWFCWHWSAVVVVVVAICVLVAISAESSTMCWVGILCLAGFSTLGLVVAHPHFDAIVNVHCSHWLRSFIHSVLGFHNLCSATKMMEDGGARRRKINVWQYL